MVTNVPHGGGPVWGAAWSRWEVTRLFAQFLKTSLTVLKIYVRFYHLDHFLSSEVWSTFTLWSDHHHHPPPELSHHPVLKLVSTQFCCEGKTAPKNSLLIKNKKQGEGNLHGQTAREEAATRRWKQKSRRAENDLKDERGKNKLH